MPLGGFGKRIRGLGVIEVGIARSIDAACENVRGNSFRRGEPPNRSRPGEEEALQQRSGRWDRPIKRRQKPDSPFGFDLRGWVLYYTSVDFAGIERLGQDEPWDQVECIRLE